MLNKPFETGTFEGQQSSVLMLEPGESYCLVSVISQNDRLIQGVKVYTYSLQEVEESIDQILASFTDNQSFDKVIKKQESLIHLKPVFVAKNSDRPNKKDIGKNQ